MFKFLGFAVLFLVSFNGISQEKVTLSGHLTDADSGEDLLGARIAVNELPGVGAITNDYGFYSLTLPKGTYTFTFKSISFETKTVTIELQSDLIYDLEMAPEGRMIGVIDVTGEKLDENVTSAEMGVDKINVKDVDNIPVLFGEKDIMKTMQLLPGVKSAGEGNSGFYVRGVSADQNLILLD